jgi:hypothetical protein
MPVSGQSQRSSDRGAMTSGQDAFHRSVCAS